MSDVPEGYKLSKVGVIPEEWEVKQFGDFAHLSKNYINPQHSNKSYPCIELEHLAQETGLLLGFVESKEQLSQKLIFSRGDVLFGKLRPYLKKFYFAEFDGVCTSEIWVIKSYNNAIGQFLFNLIQSNRFLETANQTSGTKMPRSDWKIVSCTPFPLPPLSEQQAISSALSDVDALITALEYLIAKKRNIKQGAMQQLLTGKKRLPGFGGEWEMKAIGKEIDLLTGFPFPSSQYSSCGIKLLRGSNIKRGVTDWSDDITEFWEEITPNLKNYTLNEGDIVIAMDGSLVGRSFAILSKKDLPALLLQRVARIRSNEIDVGYLKEFICSDYFSKYCDSIKTVTAIPHISPGDIRNFTILLPPSKEEQQAIAQILTDMDTEIEALKQKRNKYKAIKQGMMQELLTGKTRLL